MAVNIRGLTRIKSQALINFPPQPSLNLDFTTPYVNGLNPLPSTVTFSRADAGAYATHVGPDGLVRRAAHNLLTYSEQIENASWTKASILSFGSGSTANIVTAPNGTLTADKITPTTGSAVHYVEQILSLSAITYTVSCYVKSAGYNWVAIGQSSSSVIQYFDLINGVKGSSANIISSSIVNVGDGWFRCSVSFLSVGGSDKGMFIIVASSDPGGGAAPNWTGDGTSGIYVWGAQLEQNISPSYYVPTTSAAVYSTPRYDYDPVTLQPKGLLIEEARTNILTRSNEFSATGWTLANATVAQGVLSPDGTTNAWTFSETTTNGVHELYNSMGSAPEPPYSWSIYAKAGTSRYICIWVSSGAVVKVDLQTGTILGVVAGTGFSDTPTSEIYSAGNGWYRIVYHTTRTAAQYNGIPGIGLTNNGNITSGSYNPYAGNTGNNVLIAFGQFEAGSFATSYIPTTSSTLTRARDDVLLTGTANTIASGAVGTMYIETTSLKTRNSGLTDQILFGNASKDQLYRSVAQGNTLYTYQFRTGLSTVNSADWTNPVKSIVAFDASSASICLAGGAVASGSGSLAMTGNTYVGSDGTGAQFINGNVRQVLLYDFRMPDNKLPIITKG